MSVFRCLQYHILNQRCRLPYYSHWNHVSGTILKFVYFMNINNNKYSQYVVYNIIFRLSVPDYPIIDVEPSFWDYFEISLHYTHVK